MNPAPSTPETIFSQSIAIADEAERAAFLDRACGDDAVLRSQVEALVANHFRAGSFLEQPAVPFGVTIDQPGVELPGTQIGPYKLLQEIGEGGMGVVYMAEQAQPVRRTVALKIIKPGMDTRQVIARFEAERQALALMDHPNIAKVLDAGTTSTGRPYFVMELVKGLPITRYCDECHLPLVERLQLFVLVCQAVQHAHQKGVIHRDLKPSNVMIALYDGRPVPKVIDFGVAKATGPKLTERTLFTEFGAVIGTLEYMSPEQAELNQLDVDTRSDIYSLGVLLYELLTGSTPLDRKRLEKSALQELLRVIREEEPPKPSTRLSTTDQLASIAANRGLEPKKLTSTVQGDLDWIVMKALEKDRNRRYETANGLLQDIQRYLVDEPVDARRPTRIYRLKKFIRRNRLGVLAGAAIVAALLVGLVLATIGFVQARRQTVRADHETVIAQSEAARSNEVAQVLKDMLKGAGPSVARGHDTTMLREILEKTGERVEKDLKDQPEIQGDIWMTLGATYVDIGDYRRGASVYQYAVDRYRLALGDESTKLARALGSLGQCQSYSGDIATGKTSTELGLRMARRCGDPEGLATCLFLRGTSFDNWHLASADGVPFLREAVALQIQLGNNPDALADCLNRLAASLMDAHEQNADDAEAESLTQKALALHRQSLGPDHPKVAYDLILLGEVQSNHGKLNEAEGVFRDALDLCRKVFDESHPDEPEVLAKLADVLIRQGKSNEAESVARQGVETFPSSALHWNLLGSISAYEGKWSDAVEPFSRAVEFGPEEDLWMARLEIALLKTGRDEDYRRVRHEYLNGHHDRHNVNGIYQVATAMLLIPVDEDDFESACQFGEFASTPNDLGRYKAWPAVVEALTEYRRGHFDSAKDRAELAISLGGDWPPRQAQLRIIRALACARLQQMETASDAIAGADKLINEPGRATRESILWSWPDWAFAELLRREAVGLTERPAPATQP